MTLALQEMSVRRQSEERGTLHGLDFEEAVVGYIRAHANGAGDIADSTGATTGVIKNCKVGDCVLELGPDHTSSGEKVVFEAKEDSSYTLSSALEEIDKGRRNRKAQVGVFVWSASCVPAGTERLALRPGHRRRLGSRGLLD